MTKGNTKERFYYDRDFLSSSDARPLRIIAEYLGPRQRFQRYTIEDTIVFFGSARFKPREEAQQVLSAATPDITKEKKHQLERDLHNSRYYEDARDLAYRLTRWSKGLKGRRKRFIITSGGGPGIMEAASRGASEAKGISIGLNITLPFEQSGNNYLTDDLNLQFHYFFMRKFWLLYLAKALIVFPGGFGTLDELMELLTLSQTLKMKKKIPIILFGKEFWEKLLDWEYMVRFGTITAADLRLFKIYDRVEEAYTYLTDTLVKQSYRGPNF